MVTTTIIGKILLTRLKKSEEELERLKKRVAFNSKQNNNEKRQMALDY